MASLRGPRRTRVYNANYNIGESYYKSALDKLDRKYSGKPDPLDSSLRSSPRLRFNLDDTFDDDLQNARARASRAITEEPVFDSRGRRAIAGLPLSSAFDDDIDEEIQASLSRIRANRPKAASLMKELDLDDSFSSRLKKRTNFDLELDGEEDFGSKFKSRAHKFSSRSAASAADDLDDSMLSSTKSIVSSFKRTAITDSNESAATSTNSAASLRAKASKARLADIESEMSERSEKLLQREKRAANLKKILAENDIEEVKSLTKKVTF